MSKELIEKINIFLKDFCGDCAEESGWCLHLLSKKIHNLIEVEFLKARIDELKKVTEHFHPQMCEERIEELKAKLEGRV